MGCIIQHSLYSCLVIHHTISLIKGFNSKSKIQEVQHYMQKICKVFIGTCQNFLKGDTILYPSVNKKNIRRKVKGIKYNFKQI